MSRSGIQLCYPFETSRLDKWKPPYIVQPKLDGERCRAVWIRGEYLLFSSEQNLINSVPHINQQLTQWGSQLPHQPELDGELYRHGWEWEEIHSVVGRTVNLHPHHEMIQFHVFDLPGSGSQAERQVELVHLAKTITPDVLQMVPFKVVNTLEEIFEYYRECIDHGFEGIIVRHFEAGYVRRRSTFVMKFKPKKNDEYGIVELLEAHDKDGKPKNMLGAVRCIDDMGTEFKAGAGQLSHDQRRLYWKDKEYWKGKTINVGYQNVTKTGSVPRFGICIELIDRDYDTSTGGYFNPLL